MRVVSMPANTQERTFAAIDLSKIDQKLAELHDVFTRGNVTDLADCIKTLHKTLGRLRVSLRQTNGPFESYDGLEAVIRDCEFFIRCFEPPKPGSNWLYTDKDITHLRIKIMMQNSLLDTSALVLLAETFFHNDREPDAFDESVQSSLISHNGAIEDPDFENLWAKVKRVVYRRKRKPVPEPTNNGATVRELKSLEEEVQNRVRQLMLTNPPPIPEIELIRKSLDLGDLQFRQHLDLQALPDDKLLELAQQQERFLLSASGQRPHPRPVHPLKRRNSISPTPPPRVWTMHDDDEHLMGTENPGQQVVLNGTLTFSLMKTHEYKLSRVEGVIIDKKRKIKCTTADNNFIIIHDLPRKSKRHLITFHPSVARAESSKIVFSEPLPIVVQGRTTVTGASIITYNFTQAQSFKQFQEIVREKSLLYSFCVDAITSAKGDLASYQHLKIWRDHKSTQFTLSFYKNAVTEKEHLEFDLSSFSLNQTKEPKKGNRIVRLDFVGDPHPLRNNSVDGQSRAPNSKKRNSVDSLASLLSDTTTRSADSTSDPSQTLKFLTMEFSDSKGLSAFTNAFQRIQVTIERESWFPTFDESDEGSHVPRKRSPGRKPRASSISRPNSVAVAPPGFGKSPPGPTSISELITITTPQRSHSDYTIGVITALSIEMSAVMAMLDERHERLPPIEGDPNAYVVGSIGKHNLVITCLPTGVIGTNSAASVATRMEVSFPNIRICLMVGIGGGVPSAKYDIRLGDVVISKPGIHDGGVVQYDLGKVVRGGVFEKTGLLPAPPRIILSAISLLEAERTSSYLEAFDAENLGERFRYPGADHDLLFHADYDHVAEEDTCASCDRSRIVPREPRRATPMVHYGTIASGNSLMRDARSRDELGQRFGFLCFEMEAAGLMNTFPCLVVRGICDYADTHKNKQWQGYAAAAAAAYARELLKALQ